MNEKYKVIAINFLSLNFPLKKIKNNKNKWINAIIIPEGYLRQERAYHKTNQIEHNALHNDLSAILSNTFGFNLDTSKMLVNYYFKIIRI